MDPMTGPLNAVEWVGEEDGHLRILDQTRLPEAVEVIECLDLDTVWEAIRALRVRGAPAIGIAAAYGLVLGLKGAADRPGPAFRDRLRAVSDRLRACRPTAVNLFAYLDRLEASARDFPAEGAGSPRAWLLGEVRRIQAENEAACEAMAAHGAALLPDGSGVLTHCNAGGLATAGAGTALGVILRAHADGKRLQVFVDETRPLLQGARLTTLELMRAGVDVTLICDSAAAQVMGEDRVQAVLVGADRIARNGDVANKVGTRSLAINAAAHGIPFYVVAPTSTLDPAVAGGECIPLEEREAAEVTESFGGRIAPAGVAVYNPAFDITPGRYVTALITEKGVLRPPYGAVIPPVAGRAGRPGPRGGGP